MANVEVIKIQNVLKKEKWSYICMFKTEIYVSVHVKIKTFKLEFFIFQSHHLT